MTAKAKRRRFIAEYKRRILREADACDRGELGALLRREGLSSSHLIQWRRARDAGEFAGLTPRKRGPKARTRNASAQKLAEAERKIARLEAENAKLQLICDGKKRLTAFGDDTADESGGRERRELLMTGITFLAPRIGIAFACTMLAVARAKYYRGRTPCIATTRR